MRKRVGEDGMAGAPSDAGHDKSDSHGGGGLRGDVANICLLLLLYVLQGIPLGLAAAIPMMLQNRGVTYSQQAEFSFAFWPFSLKLLWAPIVDACYVSRFGRRKSWLVPVQYLIGLFLLVLSSRAESLIGGEHEKPNVAQLTTVFFSLNFLAATQDIAVDGWALTILQKRNVGHASTCNSVGQSAGYFLGFVVFIALESAEFCNKYLRAVPQAQGLVTFSGFMFFWAVVFLLTTTAVALFKHESPLNRDGTRDPELDVRETYSQLVRITSLKPVRTLIAILLTVKIGFSAADAVTGLKLVEAGVPKDRLALMAVPMSPLQVLLPFFISKYTAGPRPMSLFLRAMPWRLLFGLIMAGLVYVTPLFKLEDASFPLSYYGLILVVFVLHQVALYSMFVSVMAFFARISDPAVGGTYMTLLNTVTNLGGNWPATMMLWMVDQLTWKTCPSGLGCSTNADCGEGEAALCTTTLDGYYIESLACACFGFLWLLWGRHRLLRLQSLDLSAWRYRKIGV
ncbi:Acetyl-coenzyme A transporter 1 [Amphibalanus amphitrite]|uniref:Acetyl-coenzyme A transporter 1 n=1 Tax=Amphibalanus amphitrite TaxID=1232801 RepID=A0A6A4VVM8_AMPAM|nr:acetyl-coenzyme A transporter 1-like [Amphibalanus amphitrite]XP_043198249.1 acetyl-coenzyme A transporter 1-like [Amphibalanus amphitrite]XP_043228447.1 acetyl-coenzyme A transporter 1-like [Amphibalanus amphitrite]XP_043228448.1 acetyl-coenzyme A transporter 1-like [Amphibalanus amphitrite]XP_043228449.1 acetyl-coenzyme A transporter 1-like [Amphibalanus amphitrite]XP_043228450.1 acetyl-coenzyme A transporter 1-like [Amphibalanus amphitrite]XP_043228451.1 acetyl-coenzyme A transporter 1-